jgi:hypothetical protein
MIEKANGHFIPEFEVAVSFTGLHAYDEKKRP